MSTGTFIARRLIKERSQDTAFSRPVNVIAIIGIALGLAVMILAVAILTGFKQQIRDKIAGAGRDPKETTVREIMTAPVICAAPEMSLKDCSLKMQEGGVHHLPVSDERGMIIGMISANDIFAAIEEIGWVGL